MKARYVSIACFLMSTPAFCQHPVDDRDARRGFHLANSASANDSTFRDAPRPRIFIALRWSGISTDSSQPKSPGSTSA